MKTYQTTKHAMSYLEYQFVFCSRYGRKVFLDSTLNQRFSEITNEICEVNEFKLLACQTHEFWVYLKLEAPPEISPCDVLTKIRFGTSKQLRNEFESIRHLPSLWTRKYLVSTKDLSQDRISEFLQSQKKRG